MATKSEKSACVISKKEIAEISKNESFAYMCESNVLSAPEKSAFISNLFIESLREESKQNLQSALKFSAKNELVVKLADDKQHEILAAKDLAATILPMVETLAASNGLQAAKHTKEIFGAIGAKVGGLVEIATTSAKGETPKKWHLCKVAKHGENYLSFIGADKNGETLSERTAEYQFLAPELAEFTHVRKFVPKVEETTPAPAK